LPKIINHEERKEEIMEKALKVFIEKGYSNTKIAQIAEGCGISRTTLYQYFKNKDDIFRYTIKYATDFLEKDYRQIIKLDNLSYPEKIELLTVNILKTCYEERVLLSVLVEFLFQVKKDGLDLTDRIKRRTIRLQRLFSRLFQKAYESGEIASSDTKQLTNVIFALIQSYVIQVSLVDNKAHEDFLPVIKVFIKGISTGGIKNG